MVEADNMHHPQILVYETDGRLAELLRREASLQQCALRQPRRLESCLRLLAGGSPTVLLVKAGRDLVREMTLLERVHWLHPEADVVVVEESSNPALAGLAWELGAAFVLTSPYSVQELVEIIRGLLGRAADNRAAPAAPEQPILLPEEPGP
jgi:DNA-binding NtrC family response regulator